MQTILIKISQSDLYIYVAMLCPVGIERFTAHIYVQKLLVVQNVTKW